MAEIASLGFFCEFIVDMQIVVFKIKHCFKVLLKQVTEYGLCLFQN